MSGINILVGWPFKELFNFIMKAVYVLYFGLIKAIAWVLDMLTQLFFIFAGMTPVSSGQIDKEGELVGVDILNFFITQDKFQEAYLWLCLLALGLVIVFTVGKIIKQDYFDRSGPRSKAPIFRSVALSFIAFICVPIVFLFLVDAAGGIALAVMRALGYQGGGIGSMLFNISWEDGGAVVTELARGLDSSKYYDPDNFGWFSNETFYELYWDSGVAEKAASYGGQPIPEFYWYVFIFTGLILIVNLAKMMVAMVTRLYKLIALFLIAPSPISQIVLDEGQRFKTWKNSVIQEALKVVGCVMCFMIFMLVAAAVPDLDLMAFAYTSDAATSIQNLIGGNNLTTELSSVTSLYYGGATMTWIDKAVNALGRAMILIAGVGAIQDMDSVITPLLYGGGSSMEQGATGKAITTAAGAAAKGAMAIGKKAVSGAVSLAAKGIDAGVSAIGGVVGTIGSGIGDAINGAKSAKGDGGISLGDGDNPLGGGGEDPNKDKDNVNNVVDLENDENKDKDDDVVDVNNDGGKPKDGEGSKDEEKSPIDQQKEKVENSRSKMEEAKKNLDEAKKREEKKMAIISNVEAIGNSKNMSQEEKDERMNKLEEEYKKLEEGPSLEEAQEEFDSAQAAFQMDSRELNEMQGGTGDDSDDSTGVGAAVGSDVSGDDSDDSAGSGAGAGDNGNSGTDGNSSKYAPKPVMANQRQRATNPVTKGGRIGKGIAKGTLGALRGLSRGLTKTAFGVAGHGLKIAGTAAKTGASIAGIAAKTMLQMVGWGGVANAVQDFAHHTVHEVADGAKGVGRKYFGYKRDKDGKIEYDENGNPKYNTPVGKALAAAGEGIGKGFNWVKEGGITNLAFDGLGAGVDGISNALTERGLRKQEEKAALGDNNEIIQETGTMINDNTTNEQMVSGGSEVVNNANGLVETANYINDESTRVTGIGNTQLTETEGAQQKIETARGAISKHETVSGMVSEQQAVRNQLETVEGGAARGYAIQAENILSGNPGRKYEIGVKQGIIALSKRSKYKDDPIAQRELQEAYLYASTGDARYKENYDKYVKEAKTTEEFGYWHDVTKETSAEKRVQRTEKLATSFMKNEKEYEEQMLRSATEERETAVGAASTVTVMDKHKSAVKRLDTAKAKLSELTEKDPDLNTPEVQAARQEVIAATQEVQSTSAAVQSEMRGTYRKTRQVSNQNRRFNEIELPKYQAFEELSEEVGGNIDTGLEAGLKIGNIKANYNTIDGQVSMRYAQGKSLRGKDRRRMTRVGNKVKTVVDVNVVNGKGGTSSSGGTTSTGGGSKPRQTPVNTTTSKPGTKTKRVKATIYDYGSEYDRLSDNGVIPSGLGDVGVQGLTANIDNNSAFIAGVGNLNVENDIHFNETQLQEAIGKIDPMKAVRDMSGRGFGTNEFTKYTTELTDKYKTYGKEYKASIERAKSLATEFASNPDPVKLEAVKQAIAEAVQSSIRLNDIKVEIDRNSK